MIGIKKLSMHKTMEIQQFYNERWEGYSFINRTKLARCIKILEIIAGIPIDKPNILDLGCGTGWLSSILSTIGPTTGIDISDTATLRAQQLYPTATFLQLDFTKKESFPPELYSNFDIVVSQEVIEHMEDQKQFISLTASLIKTGGYLVITTPNRKAYHLLPNKGVKEDLQPVENWLTVPELVEMLNNDFTLIKQGTFIHGGIRNRTLTVWFFRFRTLFRLLHLDTVFNDLTSFIGLGLHIFVLAQKK